jgi:glycerophosphoryl diester phosphodiesterase
VPEFEVIGHRGDGAGRDENTLASGRRAIRKGADAVELDVQLFRGKLVLSHGRATERSQPLDPVLRKVRKPLILHIKRRHLNPWHDRQVVDRLAAVTRRDITVASFWASTLTYAKRHHPRLSTAFITFWPGYDLFFSRRLGASEYHAWHRLTGRRAVQKAHRRGLRIVAFTTSDKERVNQLKQAGVDGVITDSVKAVS